MDVCHGSVPDQSCTSIRTRVQTVWTRPIYKATAPTKSNGVKKIYDVIMSKFEIYLVEFYTVDLKRQFSEFKPYIDDIRMKAGQPSVKVGVSARVGRVTGVGNVVPRIPTFLTQITVNAVILIDDAAYGAIEADLKKYPNFLQLVYAGASNVIPPDVIECDMFPITSTGLDSYSAILNNGLVLPVFDKGALYLCVTVPRDYNASLPLTKFMIELEELTKLNSDLDYTVVCQVQGSNLEYGVRFTPGERVAKFFKSAMQKGYPKIFICEMDKLGYDKMLAGLNAEVMYLAVMARGDHGLKLLNVHKEILSIVGDLPEVMSWESTNRLFPTVIQKQPRGFDDSSSCIEITVDESGKPEVVYSDVDSKYFREFNAIPINLTIKGRETGHSLVIVRNHPLGNNYTIFDPNGTIANTYGDSVAENIQLLVQEGAFQHLDPSRRLVFSVETSVHGLQYLNAVSIAGVSKLTTHSILFKKYSDRVEAVLKSIKVQTGHCVTISTLRILDAIFDTLYYAKFLSFRHDWLQVMKGLMEKVDKEFPTHHDIVLPIFVRTLQNFFLGELVEPLLYGAVDPSGPFKIEEIRDLFKRAKKELKDGATDFKDLQEQPRLGITNKNAPFCKTFRDNWVYGHEHKNKVRFIDFVAGSKKDYKYLRNAMSQDYYNYLKFVPIRGQRFPFSSTHLTEKYRQTAYRIK